VTDELPTLLLCYDGTQPAEHAVAVTGKLFPGAHVHVLNVWTPIERIIARYAALAPFMGEEVTDADEGVAAEAAKTAAHGVELAQQAGLDASPYTAELQGTVWEAVLEVASALGVDAIITGTRSLHGLREAISNTLSHALIQHSPLPVLAIPNPHPAAPAG